MAQIKFMRGLSSKLPSTAVDGSFYLTTDTNRLYVGQGTDLVELNKSITVVDSMSSSSSNYVSGDIVLPTTGVAEGQFYYVKKDNILCIYKGTGWVQINPDTNTELQASTTALSVAAGAGTGDNGTGGKVNLSVSDSNSHSATGSAEIVGSGTVAVNVANGKITISGTDTNVDTNYDIKTAAASGLITGESGAKIQLDSTKTDDDTEITLKSANSNLSVSQSNGVITLNAADQSVSSVSAGFDANGKLTIGVKDETDSAPVTGDVTPQVSYGKDVADTSGKFVNGTLGLNVYTKSETDSLLAAADAMTFKGTLDSSLSSETTYAHKNVPTASTATVNAGDTYKVAKAGTYGGQDCKVGDLLIAVQDSAANTATWVLVHSGDDQVITFTADGTNGYASVSDGTGTAGYKVAGADKIDVTYSASGGVVTATVGQNDDYTPYSLAGSDDVTQSSKNTAAFTAITDIVVDKYGNVTGAEKHTFTVTDTHNSVESVNGTVTHDANGASVTVAVKDADAAAPTTGAFGVKSDNLTITNGTANGSTASGNLKINFDWGEF